MTALPKKKIYTPAEYLALEEKAETKSEYLERRNRRYVGRED